MRNKSAKYLLIGAVVSAAVLTVISVFFFDAFVIEPNWITVENVVISDRKLAASLEGTTLLQISDLHLQGELGFRERSLIAAINRIEPDYILITGDLVESADAAPLAAEFIRKLKPRYWTYGVLGNSDLHYLEKDSDYAALWKAAGLTLLGDRELRLSGTGKSVFYLAGIEPFEGDSGDLEKKLDRKFDSIPPEMPLIVLSYDPDLAPPIVSAGADLVLSGDTHGGLISFPGWGWIFHRYFGRSRFIRGLYLIGGGFLYVNRGIAPKLFPIRFLCPPEITVFQFRT